MFCLVVEKLGRGRFSLLVVLAAAIVTLASDVSNADSDEITIYRDSWGVPHIYASEESDGYYGLGYVQAEDRLSKILEVVHWARGTLSSIDAVGVRGLENDRQASRWRHLEEARQGVARLSPQLRRNYQAYIDGMNAYMAQYPERVPVWAPDIEVADVLALHRAFLWDSYQTSEGLADLRRGGEELAALLGTTQEQGASNGWVLAPKKTKEGALILGADPHSGIDGEAFYEYHIDAGGFKSAGFAMGALLWQAHNGRVTWAMTTGAPDVVDCYEVEVDPENPNRFRYDGQWRTMIEQRGTLSVANAEDVDVLNLYTRHNGVLSPVVARRGNKAYVISSAYMHQAGVLDEEIYRMNRANNVEEIHKAMGGLGMFPQNLIIGDHHGNISYVRAGRTPIRPAGYDWSRPVDGNSSRSAWTGIHPFEELVQLTNPKSGYLQNNNVAPDRIMMENETPIDAKDYPDYLFNDTPGRITTRGLRTLEVLSSDKPISVKEAIALTVDEKWINASHWQRALAKAVETNQAHILDQSVEFRKVLERLLNFDGYARADSIEALNFYHWRNGMWDLLKGPEFSTIHEFPWLERDFSQDFCLRLLNKVEIALLEMNKRYGSTEVALGQVFRIGRSGYSEPLGGVTIEEPAIENCVAANSPFCGRTMRAFSVKPSDKPGESLAYRGSHAVRLTILSDPVESYTAYAYGQSLQKGSPHYNDQIKLFSEKRLKRVYFDRENVVRHSVSTLSITREK